MPCPSRRSLRQDDTFDALISMVFPDRTVLQRHNEEVIARLNKSSNMKALAESINLGMKVRSEAERGVPQATYGESGGGGRDRETCTERKDKRQRKAGRGRAQTTNKVRGGGVRDRETYTQSGGKRLRREWVTDMEKGREKERKGARGRQEPQKRERATKR